MWQRIAWTASLSAGAFCFYPELGMVWFGHWNEPKDGWAQCAWMSVLSLVRQQRIGLGVVCESR